MPLVPYAGDPDNFPDEIDTLDDSVQRTAANLNASSEGLADRTAWLRSRAAAATEFHKVIASTTLLPSPNDTVYACGAWDSSNRQWLLGGLSLADGSGTASIYRVPNGYSDGSLGTAINVSSNTFASSVPFDVLWDGTHYVTVTVDTASHVHVNYCSPGGPWAGPYGDTSATFVHATLHQLGSQILLAYSKATETFLFYSTDHGATWTDSTYAVGGYTGGIGELVVDNGTTALVIASANAPHYIYGTSGAGIWTTANVPWGTDVPMGATYGRDSTGPAFFVVTAPGGGGMNVWKSPDGVSWLQVGGLEPAFTPQDLTSVGGTLAVAADISGGLTRGVYVSFDYGVSWRPAVNSPVVDSTAFAGLRPRIVASDAQFLTLWQASARFSAAFRQPTAV